MRVFISTDFPKRVVDEIIKIQNALPEFDGKKTEVENLHLTLKFLGEVDEQKIAKVKDVLSGIKIPAFMAELKGVEVFSKSFVRIVWIGISGCEKLQKRIDDSLEGIFKKEERFMGHLTIARVKSIKNKSGFLEKIKKINVPEISFEVNNFYLKSSVLEKEGPKYKNIGRYSLMKENSSKK